MFINTPAIQNPLKPKFSPLLPPSPLGHHLSPLGQNLAIGDFLLSLFRYNLFNFFDYSEIEPSKLDFYSLINTNTTKIFVKKSDDKVDLELNLDSLEQVTNSLFVTTKSTSIKKSLGLQTPIAQESDLIASDLISEFLLKKRTVRQTLSLRVKRNSKDLTEVIPLYVFPKKTSNVVQTQLNPNQEPASIQKSIPNKTQTTPDFSEAIENRKTSVATSSIAIADSIHVQSPELNTSEFAPFLQAGTSAQVDSTNDLHLIFPSQPDTQTTLPTHSPIESLVQLQEDLFPLDNSSDESNNQLSTPLQSNFIESKPGQLQLDTQTSLLLQKSVESSSGETTFTSIEVNLCGIELQLQIEANDTQISQDRLQREENITRNSDATSSEVTSHAKLLPSEAIPKPTSLDHTTRTPQSNLAQDTASQHPEEYIDNISDFALNEKPVIGNSNNPLEELPLQQGEVVKQNSVASNYVAITALDVPNQFSHSVPLELQVTPTTPETTELIVFEDKEPQSEIPTARIAPQIIEPVFEESAFNASNTQSVVISAQPENLANVSTQLSAEFVSQENTSQQTYFSLVSSDIGITQPQLQQDTSESVSEAESLAIASETSSFHIPSEQVPISAKEARFELPTEQTITPDVIATKCNTDTTFTSQEAIASVSVQEDSVTSIDSNYARTQPFSSIQATPNLSSFAVPVPIAEIADSPSTLIINTENRESVAKNTNTSQGQSTVNFTQGKNLNLPLSKLLNQNLPLVKHSDLHLSELITEFAEQLPSLNNNNTNISTDKNFENIFVISSYDPAIGNNISISYYPTIPSVVSSFLNSNLSYNNIINNSLLSYINFSLLLEEELNSTGDIIDTSLLTDNSIAEIISLEEWSDVAELFNQVSNKSSNNIPYINSLIIKQPIPITNILSKSHANIKKESVNNKQLTREQNSPQSACYNNYKNVPDSWSSITDLLGNNQSSSANTKKNYEDKPVITPKDLNEEYPLIELSNPLVYTSPESTSIENSFTLQSPDNHTTDSTTINEQELEILAYHVYIILRNKLENNHQRQILPNHSIHSLWHQNFFNNYQLNFTRDVTKMENSITEKFHEFIFLDNKLFMLSQEVYFLIRHFIETHINYSNYL